MKPSCPRLKLLPDVSDGNLPLQNNPAAHDDEEYAKLFKVFFWNQFLFCGPGLQGSRGPRFLERLRESVDGYVEKDKRRREETGDVEGENEGSGAAGTVYRVENPGVELGFEEEGEGDNEKEDSWAYVKRNYPSLTIKVYRSNSHKEFNRERLFWHDIDSCQSSPLFNHPHILRPLLFWHCSPNLSFSLMPTAQCDLRVFMESSAQREKARSPEYGGFRWLVKQLKGLVEAVEAVHNPVSIPGGYPREGREGVDEIKVKVGWHWDLKPGNILVTFPRYGDGASESCDTSASKDRKMKGPIFQLTDFGTSGIATFCRHQSPDRSNIPNGHKITKGNTEYILPETYLDEKTCGRDYDVWSLGGIMLEVLVWFFHGFGTKPTPNDEPVNTITVTSQAVAVAGSGMGPLTLCEFRAKREQEKLAVEKDGMKTQRFFYVSKTEPGGAALVSSVERVKDEVFETAVTSEFQSTLEGRSRGVRGLARLLDVIEGMLVVDRASRLTARDVKRRMERVWREVNGE